MNQNFVEIKTNGTVLGGYLEVPENAKGLIVFVHGAGSSRLSPRNQKVAQILREKGFGTLLFDLLTEEEDALFENRFDIDLLTKRILFALDWLDLRGEKNNLPVGLFGASTGAAVALRAAIILGPKIQAVVCRGGRVDLIGDEITEVKAPVLLIVGSKDLEILSLNETALQKIAGPKKSLQIIEGANHLFEEPNTLEQVAVKAADWFDENLCADLKK